MAGHSGAQDEHRYGDARGFAEPHAEVEQRLEAQFVEERPVGSFR